MEEHEKAHKIDPAVDQDAFMRGDPPAPHEQQRLMVYMYAHLVRCPTATPADGDTVQDRAGRAAKKVAITTADESQLSAKLTNPCRHDKQQEVISVVEDGVGNSSR